MSGASRPHHPIDFSIEVNEGFPLPGPSISVDEDFAKRLNLLRELNQREPRPSADAEAGSGGEDKAGSGGPGGKAEQQVEQQDCGTPAGCGTVGGSVEDPAVQAEAAAFAVPEAAARAAEDLDQGGGSQEESGRRGRRRPVCGMNILVDIPVE
ncbi:hypothetical protein GPECTOR_1g171 [Gonium pectorale]|uniref:Uncharacterized protein n=1 Tax=Gonium pectorale TaxID=33097 RepID=A0A150H2Y4_GONPE|nr:hypothetical protein GPECTOR_1g171 [Gonium pectorale]|eukprot:KXZ56198.1 hypothetical protein GPECTOR_1g171 [Gonium pectorale]